LGPRCLPGAGDWSAGVGRLDSRRHCLPGCSSTGARSVASAWYVRHLDPREINRLARCHVLTWSPDRRPRRVGGRYGLERLGRPHPDWRGMLQLREAFRFQRLFPLPLVERISTFAATPPLTTHCRAGRTAPRGARGVSCSDSTVLTAIEERCARATSVNDFERTPGRALRSGLLLQRAAQLDARQSSAHRLLAATSTAESLRNKRDQVCRHPTAKVDTICVPQFNSAPAARGKALVR
jgi:hypothetical protein